MTKTQKLRGYHHATEDIQRARYAIHCPICGKRLIKTSHYECTCWCGKARIYLWPPKGFRDMAASGEPEAVLVELSADGWRYHEYAISGMDGLWRRNPLGRMIAWLEIDRGRWVRRRFGGVIHGRLL